MWRDCEINSTKLYKTHKTKSSKKAQIEIYTLWHDHVIFPHNSTQFRAPRVLLYDTKNFPRLMTSSRHNSQQLHTSSHTQRTAVRCVNSPQLMTRSRNNPINHITHHTLPFYTAQKIHIIWHNHIIWLARLCILNIFIGYVELLEIYSKYMTRSRHLFNDFIRSSHTPPHFTKYFNVASRYLYLSCKILLSSFTSFFLHHTLLLLCYVKDY